MTPWQVKDCTHTHGAVEIGNTYVAILLCGTPDNVLESRNTPVWSSTCCKWRMGKSKISQSMRAEGNQRGRELFLRKMLH